MSAKYRVKDGTRVVVGGRPFSNGATFTAEPDDVVSLAEAGWIFPVTRAKAVKAAEVEDKATRSTT